MYTHTYQVYITQKYFPLNIFFIYFVYKFFVSLISVLVIIIITLMYFFRFVFSLFCSILFILIMFTKCVCIESVENVMHDNACFGPSIWMLLMLLLQTMDAKTIITLIMHTHWMRCVCVSIQNFFAKHFVVYQGTIRIRDQSASCWEQMKENVWKI